MSQIKVSSKRHLAKTISYRIISTLIGFLIMWWITGKIEIGAAFGTIELVYKPIQYYIHERVWYRWIRYGLVEVITVRKTKSKKTVTTPPQTEPRVIKEDEQPTLLTGLPERTQEKIKRLTYTKKSDN
jgi:uncharacterized membrane protein